jgi:hypothetical protein
MLAGNPSPIFAVAVLPNDEHVQMGGGNWQD